MANSREAWERVLTAVEADARRAEALLHAPVEQFAPEPAGSDTTSDTAGGRDRWLPADWLLPTATELPPLESMPPVPEELSDRILTLRSEILHLQSELATAMREVPRHQPGRPISPLSVEVPAYIDRRL